MSLYQQLLSALSGIPTQNERLIRLRTPLGAEVLLAERMTLQEHIGPAPQTQAGFRAEVFALAADTHIELKTLIGQPALIELEQADASLRPWHGHITQAALVGSDGGLARYRLTIEPWLAFLAHRQDSWVFQDASVIDIVEEVFADYSAQGKLAPDWRFELADAAAYPKRSLCIQYQESDLAFVQRLLLEEGLFCWWEHEAGEGDTLGTHTLVIADHNGAITACTQPRVRFTQSGASLTEDSLTRWRTQAAVHTARIEQASQDYRSNGGSVALRAQSQSALNAPDAVSALTLTDVPGLYAYEDSAQGQRLALRQMQALDAQRHQARAFGTLRAGAPATRFTLAEHPLHKFGSADDEFIILGAQHRARSNLRADHKAQVLSLLGAIAQDQQAHDAAASPNSTEEPVYSSTLTLQPAALAVRMSARDAHGHPDVRLHPRPTVHGVQTALVVGSAGPVHTDRDHRIKVQFHWQRGGNSSHRMPHSAGSNAPASEQSGTWVRVSEAWAGANWGANFTPRVGQEVMVGFIGGDIDRPVVSGSVYNGRGQDNAQSNQAASGAAGSTGNAPAWFPGDQASGKDQGHQHSAVLAGHKSQELSSSSSGTGGYNQLVFDDSAGANRIELATTSAQTRLQLGHLLHQTDNQRLQARGHGVDLSSAAWGAVRAGSGLLVSAHARAGGSLSSSQQIDARETQAQLDQGRELIHTLAKSAQQHKAKLQGEPDVIGAKKEQKDKQLPIEQGLWASDESLQGKDSRGATDEQGGIGGGTGTAAAWTRPDLVIAAPAGIASHTPANAIYSAGNTASLSAGQDIQHTVQANHATVVNKGLVLYTYGKASNAQKPNKETGIALHAASGNVNTQSQQGQTKLTADKSVTVASTQDMVRITAPNHVLLTAAGAALELKGGNITLKGPGKVEFRASMKELKGPASATQSLTLRKPGELFDEAFSMQDELSGEPLALEPYHIVNAAGAVVAQGITTPGGQTQRVFARKADGLVLKRGWPEPLGEAATEHEPGAKQYDEQLIFANANGALLKQVGYDVVLADGTTVSGTTDDDGRTSRITTASAQAVKEVTLRAKPLDSCCAMHAQLGSAMAEPITFAPQGVSTNSTDVGSSVKQVMTPEGEARGLTAGEIAMTRQLFGSAIDYGQVKVHNGEYLWFGLQPDDTAMTPNGEMYFNPDYFKEDFSASTPGDRHWFMHEMVHVWQYQLGYPVKARGAIRVGLPYQYELAEDKTLADYNMEAQGDLLADYWALKHQPAPPVMRQSQYRKSLPLYEKVLQKFLADPASKAGLPNGG